MTNEEAIEQLNNVVIYHEQKCTREALDLSIEALKKQIPKKPTVEKTNYGCGYVGVRDDDYTFICPTCKEEINIYDDYYYCECGQRIDWNEYE